MERGGQVIVITSDADEPAKPRPRGLVLALAGVVAAVAALSVSGGDQEQPAATSLPAIPSPTDPVPSPAPATDPLAAGWSRLTLSWPGRIELVERVGARLLAMGVGAGPIGWWSDDGSTWTPMTFETADLRSIRAVGAGPGRLVAVASEPLDGVDGASRPAVLVSTDGGRSWRPAEGVVPADGSLDDVTFAGERFVAAGTRADRAAAWSSPDGETWSEVTLPDASQGTMAASIFHDGPLAAVLGGDGTGPAVWISPAPGEDFRRLPLPPPVGDRAWGRVDLVKAEPGPSDTWFVMTRSRLGGWGRVAATSDLQEWRWLTRSFFAEGADFSISPYGLVVTGRTDVGHVIGRPARAGLEPIIPGMAGSGSMLGVAPGHRGAIVTGGRSLIGSPVIWAHGVDGPLVLDRLGTG